MKRPRDKMSITKQEAHAFVEVLLYPPLCNGTPAPIFHDYLSSDTKPGVYTDKGKNMKMKYFAYKKIQSTMTKRKELFADLSNIFHLRTMELFDFRGSNFLSLDETMVSFQSSNISWKGKKPHPNGLVLNLAGSTAHESLYVSCLYHRKREGGQEKSLMKP